MGFILQILASVGTLLFTVIFVDQDIDPQITATIAIGSAIVVAVVIGTERIVDAIRNSRKPVELSTVSFTIGTLFRANLQEGIEQELSRWKQANPKRIRVGYAVIPLGQGREGLKKYALLISHTEV